MNRRYLLSVVCTLGTASVVGCLESSEDQSSPTESGDSNNSSIQEDSGDPTSRLDDVYVENRDDEPHKGALIISKAGETIVDARYEVPAKTGLLVPDIGEVGAQYDVHAEFDGQTVEGTWEVLSCERDNEDVEGDNTNLGVIVHEEGVNIAINGCDEFVVGHLLELEYVDHEEHRKD